MSPHVNRSGLILIVPQMTWTSVRDEDIYALILSSVTMELASRPVNIRMLVDI